MYSWDVKGPGRWLFGKSVTLHLAKEQVAEEFKNWRPFTEAYIYDQETARTIYRSRGGGLDRYN